MSAGQRVRVGCLREMGEEQAGTLRNENNNTAFGLSLSVEAHEKPGIFFR